MFPFTSRARFRSAMARRCSIVLRGWGCRRRMRGGVGARVLIARNKQHPQWWTGVMWLDTSPVVDIVYRMRDVFRENFDYVSLQPNDISIIQHEKERLDQWRGTSDYTDRLVTAIKTSRHGKITTRRFSGGDPLVPFSAVMMALSQPLKPGDSPTFDVFSGGNRYVFMFKVIGRERITTALGTFNTLKIQPWRDGSAKQLSQSVARNHGVGDRRRASSASPNFVAGILRRGVRRPD